MGGTRCLAGWKAEAKLRPREKEVWEPKLCVEEGNVLHRRKHLARERKSEIIMTTFR